MFVELCSFERKISIFALFNKTSTKSPVSAVWLEHRTMWLIALQTMEDINVDINFVHSSITKKIEVLIQESKIVYGILQHCLC